MAEEQQVMKEPQQVMKEPQQVQQVTTKNPNKVKMGKRLAEYNCRKREETKVQGRGVNQYYDICAEAVIAVGVISLLGYYIYRTKKGQATAGQGASTSGEVPNNPPKPRPQSNKFEID